MHDIVNNQKQFFFTDQTKSYAWRIKQLKTLYTMIKTHEKAIMEALYDDLHKSSFEAYSTEVGFCLHSITKTIKHLKKWMKPKKVRTPFYQLNTQSFIYSEPKGTILIIGPYNYPFQLVIEPLIGVIAAGNTAIIKPSEFAKNTEEVLMNLLNTYFDPAFIKVVNGDYTITQQLLSCSFDHIFFTGSTKVGQIVYEAASKKLIPVTLELGGKSPTIIDETAHLKVAAKRIVFGKFINAGQTCIAPDYLYVHTSIKEAFIKELKEALTAMYPSNKVMGRIVNERHFKRLTSLVDERKTLTPYETDLASLYISPTLIDNVTWDDAIMKEEIFGPLLPILTYEHLDELIELLRSKEKPLALYLFSENKHHIKKVWHSLSFGGGAVNDTIMHISNSKLPFGGIGTSGLGAYHGKHSYDLFSHQKSTIMRKTWFDPPLVYPPYKANKEKLIRQIMK